MQLQIKLCSICQEENPIDAIMCSKCGATFTMGRTLQVSDRPVISESTNTQVTPVYDNAITFLISGRDEPLVIKGLNLMTLGRYVPTYEPPTIDLNQFNSGALGVSRQHAQIEYNGVNYFIRDLMSTNGSWVNEKRLPPHIPHILHNGDKIQLGQLAMNVYFSRAETTEKTLFLADRDEDSLFSRQKFTLAYMTTTFSTFLRALADLQQVDDDMQHRTHVEIAIGSIIVTQTGGIISMNIEGVRDAAHFVENMVMPWKHQFKSLIDSRSPELQKAQQELALEMAEKAIPYLSQAEKETYARRLIPIIQSLTYTTLELVSNPQEK